MDRSSDGDKKGKKIDSCGEVFIKIRLWTLSTLGHFTVCVSVLEHMCKHPNVRSYIHTLMHTCTYTHGGTCHASSQSIWWIFNIFSECQGSLFTSVTTKSLLGFKKKKKMEEKSRVNQMKPKSRAHSDTKIL